MANRDSRSEADFRKRPCGKQQRKDERSEVKSRIRLRKRRLHRRCDLFFVPCGAEGGSGKGLKRSGEELEGAREGSGEGFEEVRAGAGRMLAKTREKFGEGPAKGQRRAGGEAGKWSEKELKRGREFILRQETDAPEVSRRPATPQHTSAGRTTHRRTHGLPQIRTSQPGKRPDKSYIVAPPPDKNSVTQRLSQQDRTVTTPEYGPEVLHSSPNVLLLQ